MNGPTPTTPVIVAVGRRHGRGLRPLHLVLCASAGLLVALLWRFDPSQANLPLCTFYAMTGLECPGCGATRATHELLHGRLAAAWHYNSLWVALLPVAVYATLSELRASCDGRPLPGDLPRRGWFWLSLVALAIVFAVVRNLP